ncbi:MAG: ABC transporter permease, partial [Oscillospiraceae bacterium]
TEIRYANDEIEAAAMFSLPTTGRLPQNEDELATDRLVLEHLGIPAELGQKVTLEYSVGGEKRTGSFTLVGFWQGDKLMSASQAWLSRDYVEKQLAGYAPENKSDPIGTINAEVNFSNSFRIESKLISVILDSGYTPDEIAYGVNWAYTGNSGSADMGTILGGAGAILMIVLCGYLMISNVFAISVAKDIRFYGLLKTIGTTGKQIRFFMRSQASLLCLVGVPLGLFAGYFVGALLTPIVLSMLNTNVIKITANPIAFLLSAFFAVFTVVISIRKPSKMAAKVSPIEALHSTDGAQKSGKTSKKSGGIKLWSMALSNVLRNKKKAILVTISLSLSLILLNCAYSMANSFDMDKYLNNMIGSDFAVGDVSFFNVHLDYANQDTLSPDFLSTLAAKEGVESMSNVYFDEPFVATDPRLADLPARAEKALDLRADYLQCLKDWIQDPTQIQHIYGLDEPLFSKLTVFSGSIDIEKLKSGDYVVAAPYDTEGKLNYYNVGDKVTIANAAGESKKYQVLAVAAMPYNISVQHSHAIAPEFFLSTEIFLRDIAAKAPMLTTLEVTDVLEPEMENYLRGYCENIDQNMQYRSKATLVAEYENTRRTYQSVGLILSVLVAFIGVMNFINTVVTSIVSRRRELAMLQSIGMTRGQTQTMLILEGLIYTVFTAVFALTVGSVLGYLAIGGLTGGGAYMSPHFTVLPSLLCLPILAAISVLVPYFSCHSMHRDSIVERLREAE